MDEDIVERPVCNILYRQSSIETRLSPTHLSDEDSSDDSVDEVSTAPKVVDYQLKSDANYPGQVDSLGAEKLCSSSENKENSKPNGTADNLFLNKSNVSQGIGINESLHHDNRDLYADKQEFSSGTLKGKHCNFFFCVIRFSTLS